MSLQKKVYYRSVYGSLDLTSDLGGMFTALHSLFALILIMTTSYSSYQFVMAELFVNRINRSIGVDVDSHQEVHYTHRVEMNNNVQWNLCKQLRLTMQYLLPSKCRVCCLR